MMNPMNTPFCSIQLKPFLMGAFLLSVSTQSFSAYQYEVINLGTLGVGPVKSKSHAYAINNSGQVTGNFSTGWGQTHAFLYDNGTMLDLCTLGGSGYFSHGYDINNSGQVTGNSSNRSGFRAFLYDNGTMTDLGTMNGGSYSYALGINDKGQVTGYAGVASGYGGYAFIYSNGRMINIGTSRSSSGNDINNSSQVTGYAVNSSGDKNAFIYDNRTLTYLGTLGGKESVGHGINDYGQITGTAEIVSGESRAFIYDNGIMIDLGTLGGSYSSGSGINESGQVTGSATNALNKRKAFLWSETTGMLDLNDLIDPNSGWELVSAEGINDLGQIVGYGRFIGEGTRAFLLNPVAEVPEPSTLALMFGGLGLVGLLAARRKKNFV